MPSGTLPPYAFAVVVVSSGGVEGAADSEGLWAGGDIPLDMPLDMPLDTPWDTPWDTPRFGVLLCGGKGDGGDDLPPFPLCCSSSEVPD